MKKRLSHIVPMTFVLFVTASVGGGIQNQPGYGNSIASAVNDQTGQMKCAKGKHYNTRTRTCDPD
jgi:hypothetical protein